MSIYNTLFHWQKNIVDEFKSRDSFGIFLDMGLGKTPISLAFAEANHCTKVLIISINAKAQETQDDNGSWLNWALRSDVEYAFKNKHDTEFSDEAELLLANYESLFARGKAKTQRVTLKSNIARFIDSCKAHNVALIVDESHKMKNLQSQQTNAILKIQKELKRKANKVYTYLLTGTPFTTGYIDLYAQLKALGYQETKGYFIDNFCERGNIPGLLGWQQPIVGYKNLKELFDVVHKYAITAQSSCLVDLPETIFIEHTSQTSFDFEMFTKEYVQKSDILHFAESHDIDLPNASRYTTDKKYPNPFFRNIAYPNDKWIAETSGTFWLRARQLSIGFNGNAEENIWYDNRRLMQLRDFLANNEDNYVIFYNFTPELLEIYDICEKLNYNIDVYCGEIKSLQFYNKFASLSDSQKLTQKKNVIIANFASGSTGMNWQEYNKCIIFSLPVYKDYAQALKRIHRVGQKRTVFYHIFYQRNWLDKSMMSALKSATTYNHKLFEDDIKRVNEIVKI